MEIRALREAAGLSQRDLGQALGVGQNAVSNWERGLRQPDADMLSSIADFFGVTVDRVLGREKDKGPDETGSYAILSRGARSLTEEQRRQLLDMARILFKEAFEDE